MNTPSSPSVAPDPRQDPRHFCRYCGEPIAASRLICAPADANRCLDRQEREASVMSRRYVVTPAGVAALEASRRQVA